MFAFIKALTYIPLYNLLVTLLNIPYVSVGLAIIILTILVKVILYPLSKKTAIMQVKMKKYGPELMSIKRKFPDRQEQAVKIMEFYRSHKINPVFSILGLLIQIPIILALYYVFYQSGLPSINTTLLYPFISVPESVNMSFLYVFHLQDKSIILATVAAITTYIQMAYSPAMASTTETKPKSETKKDGGVDRDEIMSMMTKQMKYTMPIIVLFVSYSLASMIALYWAVSNVVGIVQDYYIKKHVKI